MIIRFLGSAAVTGLLLNAAVGLTPAAAQTAALHTALASDSAFIQMVGSLGLLQVKLGKLAAEKASSDVVREFGKRMVAEYTKTNEELSTGAKQAAYPRPVLLRDHQQIFDRFNGMSRSSFDKNYMAEMVKQHDETVRLFQAEAKDGRVQSLKQLASSMLPAVQERQALATQTAGAVGANATASSAKERQGS